MRTGPVCPDCGKRYIKSLYDWQYIQCDCGTYFEKHTGALITRDGTPQDLPKRYWQTDEEGPRP